MEAKDTVLIDIDCELSESELQLLSRQASYTWGIAMKEIKKELEKYDGSYIDKRFWGSKFWNDYWRGVK